MRHSDGQSHISLSTQFVGFFRYTYELYSLTYMFAVPICPAVPFSMGIIDFPFDNKFGLFEFFMNFNCLNRSLPSPGICLQLNVKEARLALGRGAAHNSLNEFAH